MAARGRRFHRRGPARRQRRLLRFNSVVENFTHCFAAPVRQADGACIATLCLVTPREDGLNNRDAYLDSLLRAAREISEKLGFNLAGAARA